MQKPNGRSNERVRAIRKTAVPRGRSATLSRVIDVLSRKLGRTPSDLEVSRLLAISEAGVAKLRSKIDGGAR